MKLWAKLITNHKIVQEAVREYPARPSDVTGWNETLLPLCHALDLARPVLLQKHVSELKRFNRTVFTPRDFMENVSFEQFEIEIFPEKKKENPRD